MIIRPAIRADLDAVASNLGTVFAADPSLGWVLRKADDPESLLADFYRLIIDSAFERGIIDVAEDEGDFLGSAVWTAPGQEVPASVLRKALPLVRRLGKAAPTLLRYLRAYSAVKIPFPAWHLEVIAVTERARGRGVGSALLDAGLERCGDEAARLEATSTRAAKLYASRGFVPLGEVKTPAPVPEIIMWKPSSTLLA
ncbi:MULTISPECIES: GNAT family N-acetyltransferase [Flaviflexus]|uniref:N-acetyltransferase n=1 Tax=Flaviflexus ciconiae TaxID=2496867 RepID=A0A3S9PUF1_9ACTO|nr:GNAT family N-acetyltransferase [Flaviflexus ciconiae]AZQ75958.1 N-acetyltransferase [Flaviflexus ciconiae]